MEPSDFEKRYLFGLANRTILKAEFEKLEAAGLVTKPEGSHDPNTVELTEAGWAYVVQFELRKI